MLPAPVMHFPMEAKYVDFLPALVRRRRRNAEANDVLYIAELVNANLELLPLDIAYFEEGGTAQEIAWGGGESQDRS